MDAVAQQFVDKMVRELNPQTKKIDNLDGKMFLWSLESISLVLLNRQFGEAKAWKYFVKSRSINVIPSPMSPILLVILNLFDDLYFGFGSPL